MRFEVLTAMIMKNYPLLRVEALRQLPNEISSNTEVRAAAIMNKNSRIERRVVW
jgi:hypothetical protein